MRTYLPNNVYVKRNSRTGKVKVFKNFKQMQSWYKRLSLEAMFEWAGWDYHDINCNYHFKDMSYNDRYEREW